MSDFKITHFDDEKSKELLSDFRGQVNGWVRVGDKKWMLPDKYKQLGSIYRDFKVKPDDIWIVTVPRSGTTWTQEMIWLLHNDMNFSVAKSVPLEDRFPFLELSMTPPNSLDENANEHKSIKNAQEIDQLIDLSHERAEQMSSPRFLKSHFPLSLLPNVLEFKSKVIYVARNPKDVCVSYYNFYKDAKVYDYQGDFEKFWNYFKNGLVMWAPYWDHVKEAWAQRHNPNLLFLFYEELSQDLISASKKVATFLGKSYTDEEYEKLADHLSFKNLKSNKMANLSQYRSSIFHKDSFIREGKMQGWHKMFTPELNEEANRWIAENLKDTDLKFPHIDIYS